MKFTILITTLIFSFTAFASVPTVEGLFRNAHNASIKGNTVAVSFTIESLRVDRPKERAGEAGILTPLKSIGTGEESEFDKKVGHYKLIFTLEDKRPTPMLQVRYSKVGMSPSEVIDTFIVSDIESHIRREKVLEKQYFYSLVQMFVLNSSTGFNALLKKQVQNYKGNNELIDPEKKRLYERYMIYLKQVKEAKKNKEDIKELSSPFKPDDEKELEKVEKIKARRFYTDFGNVKLVRESEKFFWSVDLIGMNALFTQEEHRLKRLRLETLQGGIETSVANYVLMDGTHELPQKVIMDHLEYGRYQISFLSTQDFDSQSTSFSDRVEEYRKWQEANISQKGAGDRESLDVIPYMY
jgi:hypothetical protein